MEIQPTATLDRIDIHGLHLRCIIGIQEWERKKKQDVLIDVTLFANLVPSGNSDRIADTVNYRTLSKRIIALTESSSFQLVESLADAIARLCLADEKVVRARVAVDKPGALRFARSVGVTIERQRA